MEPTLNNPSLYSLAADLLLILHVMVAAFIVFGLVLVYVGRLRRWEWILNPWFRTLHLLAIGIVALQAWIGTICPLTTWEMALRQRAGEAFYEGSFVAHWLHKLLYWNAPPWVFITAYSGFGMLVLLSWFLVRPRPFVTTGSRTKVTTE